MNIAVFLPLCFLWIIIFIEERKKKNLIKNVILSKKRKLNLEEINKMKECARNLIGKDIYCTRIDGNPCYGILINIIGNALMIEEKNQIRYVNLDYICTLQEYPHNKKGKRKNILS